MKKTIIGLVGLMASGKGTAASYFRERYGARIHKFSPILRDLLTRLHLEINRENMQNISNIVRRQFGEEILARALSADVENDTAELIVVDGIRRPADITYLEKLPGFILVKIEAEPALRHERMIRRGENADDTTKTFEQFLLDHEHPTEREIPSVMATAAHSLDNNVGLDGLHQQIDELMEKLA